MSRLLFDRTDQGCCIIEVLLDETGEGADYRFLQVNRAFESQTGLRDAVGRRMRELAPAHEEFWFRIYARIAREGEEVRFEHEAKALGRWYEVHAFRVGEPEQRLVAIIFKDIAWRKRAERALIESEARFRDLADDMPMPVWVLDGEGRVQYVNKAYCRFFRLEQADVLARPWRPHVHPEDQARYEQSLQASLSRHEPLLVTVRIQRHDGAWRWMEVRGGARVDGDGRLTGLTGAFTDVTERRELDARQEQLLAAERAARASAETAARVKDEFLATLSHELRTPLSVILGWSQLLLKHADADEVLQKGLAAIAHSAQAQTTLISDMLDMSSFLLGKTRLKLEPVDIRALIQQAVGTQEPTAAEKGLCLVCENLPQPCWTQADPTRLKQILWNLLSNAIKFTPAGGRIRVCASLAQEHVEIAVHDTGAGIAPDFLPFLFDRFRQADGSISRKHGGLGLGLSIVQQLAEMHGGSVQAASAGLGQGATFTVRLPLIDPDKAALATEGVVVGKDVIALDKAGLQGYRILAVDDQEDILDYLRRILEEQGAQVRTATSAREVLALLDGEGYKQYDVLLTDIGMPDMDGYQLLQILREDKGLSPGMLRAIAVTALARADDRRRAFAAGFDAHLSKPYTVSHLVAAIRGELLPS
ncbi:PAS domain S-box protein [Orrella sp. JC864]|uniref:hybrid sensor histidine kinase/response regulator n=1 Tax=Orrella sp. JC864 TaxID=3120298 RepID=UPI0030080510